MSGRRRRCRPPAVLPRGPNIDDSQTLAAMCVDGLLLERRRDRRKLRIEAGAQALECGYRRHCNERCQKAILKHRHALFVSKEIFNLLRDELYHFYPCIIVSERRSACRVYIGSADALFVRLERTDKACNSSVAKLALQARKCFG